MIRKPVPGTEDIRKLPSDGGEEFNRLIFEQSPYLLQHARNPVDWYPWGEEAFALAEKLNRMIFLSVGYSTCHWCHVMEHESFEDPDVARLMNDNFVCIKVDREERPDIDALYMKVTQAMTGSGGWPMTVVMTPDRKPFFAGTYFPKGGSGPGRRSGMMEIIPQLAAVWKDKRNDALDYAEAVTTQLRKLAEQPAGQGLAEKDLDRAVQEMSGAFDPEFGGFRGQRKFPLPHKYLFLLRHWHRTGDDRAMKVVEKSLESMRLGGMWDHIGYGFHRYSTDPKWLLPHFEKMLYDQALLAWAYTEAWQCSGNKLFRSTAENIYTYILRDMTSPDGGFFSAEDADSQGEEGLFYTWTMDEIYKILGKDEAVLFKKIFGFSDEGNFIDEATRERSGRNIIHLTTPWKQTAQGLSHSPEDLAEKWKIWRKTLFETRLTRVPPLKDDKVLTDWNGLMIASLAKAGMAFQDRRLIGAAEKSARFAMKSLRRDDGTLMKRWRGGVAGLDAHLDDYAFMILGLVELYQSTRNPEYLQYARELSEHLIRDFLDKENHGFFLSALDSREHIAPIREIYDGAIPSGNSVAALALLKLARITGNTEYKSVGENIFKAFSGVVSDSPSNYALLMCALDFHLSAGEEIVIAAPKDEDEESLAIYESLARRYAPNSVIIYKSPSRAAALAGLAPFTEFQEAIDGKTTIYICRNFSCKAPVFSLEDALRVLSEASPE